MCYVLCEYCGITICKQRVETVRIPLTRFVQDFILKMPQRQLSV